MLRLASIHRYPVKSCGVTSPTSSVVEPWGLAGDRRWMVVDDEGGLITAREHPLLLQVGVTAYDGGLTLTAPGRPELVVAEPADGVLVRVRVWSSHLVATLAAADAQAWFGALLGRTARLVHLDDPTRRATNPAFSQAADRVSFADGYPLLLTTTASLAELNRLIAEGDRPDEGPLPMARFRPNVVVDAPAAELAAWVEDGWRSLAIGGVSFRVAKGCARCTMTMTDATTLARSKEPIATLSRHRRWDRETWFGMSLIPDLAPGDRPTLTVGDRVEILDAVAAPDGPPR